jgi:hypothetical protein
VKQALYVIGLLAFILGGTMWAQPWSDWTSAENNVNIIYHFRLWDSSKSCDLEFRDQNQGDGSTTFDAAVDYQTPTSRNDQTRIKKTETEHIVTTANHNGGAQIPNCFGITEVRVSFVIRH